MFISLLVERRTRLGLLLYVFSCKAWSRHARHSISIFSIVCKGCAFILLICADVALVRFGLRTLLVFSILCYE